jgi:hypothetical protein
MSNSTPTLAAHARDTTPLPPFVAVIIQELVDQLGPLIRITVEMAVLTTACVPILLSVLYFSTSASRATIMWRLVVAELLYGIAIEVYGIYTYVRPTS